MRLSTPLVKGRLVKRYKRFLADVILDGGETVTAHCANPGSMLGLVEPGMTVWLSRSDNPKRKLKFSWELVEAGLGQGPVLVGINTAHPNKLVEEAILAGQIAELAGYDTLRREVRYGTNSRIDILLEGADKPPCYVEIKNVHLVRDAGLAEFPDSVTARGAKHLAELSNMASAGARAVMVFLVQRADANRMGLARDIDPAYGAAFDAARAANVEALCYCCDISTDAITVRNAVPITGA